MDFVQVACGMGADGIRVDKDSAIRSALYQIRLNARSKPAICLRPPVVAS